MPNFKDIKKLLKRFTAPYANNSPFAGAREGELHEKWLKGEVTLVTDDCFFTIDNPTPDSRAPSSNDKVEGVIIARKLTRSLTMRDFAQRNIELPPGVVWCGLFEFADSVTWGHDYAQNLLHYLRESYEAPWFAIECYAENFAMCEALESCGLARRATKVSAFAEVRVIYTNFALGMFDATTSTVAKHEEDASLLVLKEDFLDLNANRSIHGDLNIALEHGAKYATHYSIYNKDDKWSGLAIRGFDKNDPSFIEKPSEMSRRWKQEHPELLDRVCENTVIAHWFQPTLRYLQRKIVPGLVLRLERVRILKLEPGGHIMRHCDIQDKEAGLRDDMIVRLHVPLKTNKTVFHSWGVDGKKKEMEMPLNSLCYLDHRKPHAVINGDSRDRIHLVVDVYSNENIRELIRNAYRQS